MSNFEQAKARIHLTGQKENCTYIYLVTSNTVYEKILKALKNKGTFAKSLIDDYKNGFNTYESGRFKWASFYKDNSNTLNASDEINVKAV